MLVPSYRSRILIAFVLLVSGWQASLCAVRAGEPSNAESKYVGSDKCVDCHKSQHQSYLNTTHSIAAEWTDVKREPAAGAFFHSLSENTYKAVHRDGKLIHQEIRHDPDGKKAIQNEAEIVFSIGSGAHGKSYLLRDGDFWVQSPISWFKDTQAWGMSPGYDRPTHASFRRNMRSGCVFCHVGSIDAKEGNPFLFEIKEATVGCERCHGPGEQHVKLYRDAKPEELVDQDPLIVNPDELPRALSEAICQQCHLQAASKAIVSGKSEWDFRPGMDLTDVRIDYQYHSGKDEMKIVGHVEQMHQSECYQQTETLTCITCHDPHNTPAPDVMIDHYRSICLNCHQDESCGKPHSERIRLAKNDCSQCHMPKMDTNVAHAAFRQHKIGVYSSENKTTSQSAKGLFPVVAPQNLSTKERQRCDAIGKFRVYESNRGPEFVELGLQSAATLVKLKEAGFDDVTVNATLAQLAREQGQARIAAVLSQSLVNTKGPPTNDRIDTAELLAEMYFQRGSYDNAVQLYRFTTKQKRSARDFYFLGLCENNTGNVHGAIAALNRSLEIDPLQEAAHVALKAIYQAGKKPKESEYHSRQAELIRARLARLNQRAKDLAEKQRQENE